MKNPFSWQLLLFLSLTFFLSINTRVAAQDVRFTQTWAAPMVVNPAWTGTVPYWRATMLYRHQWFEMGASKGLQSFYGGFDYYLGTGRGSVGAYVTEERISSLGTNQLEAALTYAYRIKFDGAWQLSMALQASYGQRSQGMNKLRFEDAMLAGGTTLENLPITTIHYPDIATGLILYNQNLWAGVGVYHLLTPNRAYLSNDYIEETPIRITSQLGYRFEVGYEHYLVPSTTVSFQGSFSQLNFGTNWEWQWLYVGLWHRGIPFQSESDAFPSTSLALVSGVKAKNWSFGLSYGVPLSSLRAVGTTYEVSLSYAPKYDPRRSGRAREETECPINFR